jgi:transcriptional antiterminator NusG
MSSPRWYVVQVQAGAEKKVAEEIKEQAAQKNLESQVVNVLVPSESVIEMRRGEKTQVEKNFFPGYILIQMVLTDDTWHLISQTAKVKGFLGGKGKPTPVSQGEVDRILGQVENQKVKPKHSIRYDIGDQIRVTDGPFVTFTGVIEEVDDERERLKVSVMIFGRSTPVDLEFSQVERVS